MNVRCPSDPLWWGMTLMVLLLPGAASAQARAGREPLRTTEAIQRLDRDAAGARVPAELEAIASYSEPTWRLLFVEDATGGIYCETSLVRDFPKPGERVRVRGVTDSGAFLPYLIVHELELLGSAPALVPRRVTAEELWRGDHDGDLVRLMGIVTSLSVSTNAPVSARLEVASGALPVQLTVMGFAPVPASNWIGAEIEFSGVFAPDTDDDRRLTRIGILSADPSQLSQRRAPDLVVRDLPISHPSALGPTALRQQVGLVRLRGTVMLSDDTEAWVGDPTNSVPVRVAAGYRLQAGDQVDLVGIPVTTNSTPVLSCIRILERRSGLRAGPVSLGPGGLMDPLRHGQLVTVEGELLHRSAGGPRELWVLGQGESTFEVSPYYSEPRTLTRGTRLRLTGVRSENRANPAAAPSPRVLVGRLTDLEILSPPPWPLRRTLGAVSILSGCLAMGLIALAFSHRRQRDSVKRAERADAELREFNLHLENRITDRTAELAAANRSLQVEIAERQRAQAELADREARLRHAQSLLRVGSFHWSAPAQLVTWSDELYHLFGRDPGTFQPSFEAYLAQIHADDRENVKARIHEALRTGRSFTHDYRFHHPNGSLRWVTSAARVLFDERGHVIGLEGTCQDVTARKLEEQFRIDQARVLEAIAHGAPLSEVFDALVRAVESQAEGMLCSVMLVETHPRALRLVAAPSLSAPMREAVDRLPIGEGPESGICGSAAHRCTRRISEDIERDPGLEAYRPLARAEGIRACWSEPILDHEGVALGTFACYFRTPQTPTTQQLALITSATHTAAIGIQRERNERSLRATTEALSLRNEMLQRMERMAHVGAWSLDLRTLELTWSEEVSRIHELPLDQPITVDRAIEFYAPEARPIIREAVERGCRDGTPWDLELPFVSATGRRLWVRTQGQAESVDGHLIRLHGAFQDITQRRAAAEELRTSEERFQLAMRGANDGLWDWDLRTDAAYFSPRWKSMLGYDDHELANHIDTWAGLLEPAQRDRTRALAQEVIAGRVPTFETEIRLRHKDGRWVDILSRAFVLRAGDGTPLRLVGTHVDITERKHVIAAVLAAEARFRSAIEYSYEGLSLTDADGHCIYVSPAVTRISGYGREELVGRKLGTFIVAEDAERFAEHALRIRQTPNAHVEAEFRIRHKDGSIRWIQTAVTNRLGDQNLAAVVSNIRDITAQKFAAAEQARLESQLRQAQKMEAIGTLAGGIAHDFNNILGAIIGHTQLARMDAGHLPEVQTNLDDALSAANRAKELVKQILTFSRRGEPERRIIPLQPLFDESLRLLRAALPATAQLQVRVQDPVPDVFGDATLLQQVIFNLATNAAQAIGDRPGRISISLEGTEVGKDGTPGALRISPGSYARLCVGDDGPGMDAATLERVFEPFFTTKPAGQGTGLGLAVVHGIVEKHQGTIRVQSSPGEGSVFEVFLPAAQPGNATPGLPSPSQEDASALRRGRILVVDDEPSLLRITERVLGLEGYEVTAFSNPIEARLAFLRSPHHFDLLITDYLMPGQNGVDLARQITEARPELPMIICSGHSFGLTRERATALGFRDLLQKPVEFESLRQAVRAALPG